jgi:hypothetical protein
MKFLENNNLNTLNSKQIKQKLSKKNFKKSSLKLKKIFTLLDLIKTDVSYLVINSLTTL